MAKTLVFTIVLAPTSDTTSAQRDVNFALSRLVGYGGITSLDTEVNAYGNIILRVARTCGHKPIMKKLSEALHAVLDIQEFRFEGRLGEHDAQTQI